MKVITARNVNGALLKGVDLFKDKAFYKWYKKKYLND